MDEQHRYDYIVDPEDSNHVATKITKMVGKGKRVLEVGAGPGSITRCLQGAGCKITAVELDAEALPYLTPFCEQVFQRDLNDHDWASGLAVPEGYDMIVAADVLEHLLDPWQTLKAMKGLLAPDGEVVVSLPHAGHNAILAALLCGDFNYQDWGLLDRTHLRFFGMKNIEALLVDAGYAIVDYDFVLHPPETTELGHYWDQLPERTRKTLERSAHGHIYQVVVKARPQETAKHRSLGLEAPKPEPNPTLEKLKACLKPFLPAPVRSGLRRILSLIKIQLP